MNRIPPKRDFWVEFFFGGQVEHEPNLSCSFTLTTYTPTMTRQWQSFVLVVLPFILNTLAVTRYIPEGQETLFGLQQSSTDTSLTASYTGSAAYDPRTLIPPVPPTDPPVNLQFAIQLANGDIPDLSIRHHGAFLGFSIEFSVSNHVCESPLVIGKLTSFTHLCLTSVGHNGCDSFNRWLPQDIANIPSYSAQHYLFRS